MISIKIMYSLFIIIIISNTLRAEVSDTDLNDISEQQNAVKINKCCEPNDLEVNSKCRMAKEYQQRLWQPKFKNEEGKDVKVKYFQFITGMPDCETTQQRAIYSFGNSEDELNLLSDGRLQHLIHHEHKSDSIQENLVQNNIFSLHDAILIPEKIEPSSYIHKHNKYCMDKIFLTKNNMTGIYALVCVPEVKIDWSDTDFLLRKILDTFFHSISIILYLIVAVVYCVIAPMNDLAGCLVSTIQFFLLISQCADIIKIFPELENHVSLYITDAVIHFSIVGAFIWLCAFGFNIWRTFKSRNIFLRMTYCRKFCYYGAVLFPLIAIIESSGLVADYFMDKPFRNKLHSLTETKNDSDISIGSLGLSVFYTAVAISILFDIFFYVSTQKIMKKITYYGRIHHNLKESFHQFCQIFLIMTAAWMFRLLSLLKMDALFYVHIVVNFLQAILMFYICLWRRTQVSTMVRICCCDVAPVDGVGEEMTHMNGGNNYYNNYN